MNHSVAVGAEQGDVIELRHVSILHRMNWVGVMCLDVARSTVAIGRPEVETTRLAFQLAMLFECRHFAESDQLAIALEYFVLAVADLAFLSLVILVLILLYLVVALGQALADRQRR